MIVAALLLLIGLVGPTRAEQPAVEAADPSAGEREALEERVALLERLLLVEAGDELASTSGQGGVSVPVGEVVRNAVGLGGPVEVGGSVRGHAVGLGGDVTVQQGGQVDGDAVALGGEVLIQDGGQVTGRTLALSPQESASRLLILPGADGLAGMAGTLARRLAMLLAFVAAGTLAISLWPGQVDEIGRRLSDRPFWYGIAGAVLTMALLIGATVLTVTVIGIPIALLFVFVLGLAWLMGLVAACRSVGRHLSKRFQFDETASWLLGALLFVVLAMVPALGTIMVMLIGFPAAGAAVVASLSQEPAPRSW